jgi:hypothetical protein
MSQLPIRKTADGDEIETRPLYIEEWLDSLPYIDFNKTSALLYEALVATNKATIKSATRIELAELYNRPYQYYVESQIKAGAHHTLQTIDAMQNQVSQMKQIAVALSFACKLAFDTALNKKTLWKQAKPPVEAMLMSMNYLSHALVLSFLEYAPVPKKVWQQLNFIYSFAESIGCHKKTYSIPGANNKNINTSIDHTFKKIIMASLVDPHHLPFGAIWEVYDQLDSWADHTQIIPMRVEPNTTGYFVIDLKSDDKPMPLVKFSPDNSNENNRLLDSIPLQNLIQKQMDLLQMEQPIDKSIVLSPFYAKSLLSHMLKAWGLPPKRYFPRKVKSGHLNIVTGISAIYYYLNNGNAFRSNIASESNDDEIDVLESPTETASQVNYIPEIWRVIDEGSGGYAIIRDDKTKKAVRVGDLVGINNSVDENNWSIGVVRWLMLSRGIHKVGLQIITETAQPIVLCASTGSQADRELRPAFMIEDKSKQRSIIAEKGLYLSNREMEMTSGDQQELIVADNLNESSISYDFFKYKMK